MRNEIWPSEILVSNRP